MDADDRGLRSGRRHRREPIASRRRRSANVGRRAAASGPGDCAAPAGGGYFFAGVPAGDVTDHEKIWWVQFEALAGLWWGGGKGVMARSPEVERDDPKVRGSLYQEYGEHRYAAPPLLKRMVEAGMLGRKTGTGFYEYD